MSVGATFFDDFPGLGGVFNQTSYKDMRSLMFLHYLVGHVQPKLVLELGTGFGCSTVFMALAVEEGRIATIDNYQGVGTKYSDKVERNLESCGVQDKVTLIQGSTFDTGELVREHLDEDIIAPEIVFMDASHIAVDLRREYDALQGILPGEHVIVIDDTFTTDTLGFIAWMMKEMGKYVACVLLPYHNGLAVLVTNDEYLSHVSCAIAEVVAL